ncbi:MAG: hypothetical protein KKG59_01255 [Nanoarchaeota archaeon]|nr:hypothetical protein [Nanoarchaeota archaeon]
MKKKYMWIIMLVLLLTLAYVLYMLMGYMVITTWAKPEHPSQNYPGMPCITTGRGFGIDSAKTTSNSMEASIRNNNIGYNFETKSGGENITNVVLAFGGDAKTCKKTNATAYSPDDLPVWTGSCNEEGCSFISREGISFRNGKDIGHFTLFECDFKWIANSEITLTYDGSKGRNSLNGMYSCNVEK